MTRDIDDDIKEVRDNLSKRIDAVEKRVGAVEKLEKGEEWTDAHKWQINTKEKPKEISPLRAAQEGITSAPGGYILKSEHVRIISEQFMKLQSQLQEKQRVIDAVQQEHRQKIRDRQDDVQRLEKENADLKQSLSVSKWNDGTLGSMNFKLEAEIESLTTQLEEANRKIAKQFPLGEKLVEYEVEGLMTGDSLDPGLPRILLEDNLQMSKLLKQHKRIILTLRKDKQ